MYKIIADSCADLTNEMKMVADITLVPLTLSVGDETVVDDSNFNQADFLRKMKNTEECPKSACPSPEHYMREFEGADEIYVVTLSANLSGSYNSAELARRLYLEEHEDAKIAVFNSCSASVGETLIAIKIKELLRDGADFDTVVKKVNEYRDTLNTKFVLDSLENLRKNGRLKNITAALCDVLNIKPIMGATDDGDIIKLDQARGMKKALQKMIQFMEGDVKEPTTRILGISHCNNRSAAEFVKNEILQRMPFKDCIIVETAGVSTMYANDGGVIVCY